METDTVVVFGKTAGVAPEIQGALRADGYRVLTVRDQTHRPEWLEKLNGRVALVVIDLDAASDPGEQVRAVRSFSPAKDVVAISSSPTPAQVVAAIRNGATDYLGKPASPDRLLSILRCRAEGRSARPEAPDVFIDQDPAMRDILSALPQIALSDAPLLLTGESGSGKEVLARTIHARSPRASRTFAKINCAALPSELLESELFGYERGAFTGASRTTLGKLEAAERGTILLDEIGELDVRLQAKLLHVLQDSSFQRLGGRESIRLNVRFMAATNCDLERAIAEHRFRDDLYYRLNVISIRVPPLRERKHGLLQLARHLLKKHSPPGTALPMITPALEDALLAYPWPGNVRELENLMRRLIVFRDAETLALEIRSRSARAASAAETAESACDPRSGRPSLSELRSRNHAEERAAILASLGRTCWNRRKAAVMLGVSYKHLLYRMGRLDIGADRSGAQSEVACAHRG